MKTKRWLTMILVVTLVTALMVPGISALSLINGKNEIVDESGNSISNKTIELFVGDAMFISFKGDYSVQSVNKTTVIDNDVSDYTSSNPDVATVAGKIVSAIAPGTTVISITCSDIVQDVITGETATVSGYASFTVKVKEAEFHNPFEGIDLSQVENPFSDLSVDDWYYEDVMYLYAAGFFDGVELVGGDVVEPVQLAAAGNGTVSLHRLGTANAQIQKLASGKYQFNGGSNAGRAWNVSVLYNGHQSAGGSVGSYQTQWFTDVPTTASYFQPVQWAAYTSTVKGYGDDLFGPLDGITREQFCTILLRYAQRFGLSIPSVVKAKTFSDAGQISSWAKDAVNVCQQAGIIKGMGNNTFAPKAGITTGQAAAMIHRFFENCTGGKTV